MAELREWYPRMRPAGAALTTENILDIAGAVVTQVGGFAVDGRLGRIVLSLSTPQMVCGAEFYLRADSLRMTFESCEYADGAMAPTTRRNLFGLRAWERRVYFGDASVVFEETHGEGAPDHRQGAALQAAFRRARAVLPTRPAS